jgi:NAD-dependent dihydropyrimidine dehydrogenase PreA subunit
MSSPNILLCLCRHAEAIPRERVLGVLGGLRAAGVAAEAVDDLCGLAAEGDPLLRRIAEAEEPCVVACHARAIRWLFHAAGAPLDMSRTRLFDLRTLTAEEVLGAIVRSGAGTPPFELEEAEAPDWQPWFPVIDYDRCTACRQCYGFCLFGVYELANGQVRVGKPANCKYGCPACARICPAGAIIFPKHQSDVISGGDAEAKPEPKEGELKTLLEGDVLDALRRRGVEAKPGEVRKALDERMPR